MEAKRVTKEGGVILVAYCMNEYAVLTYAFKEHHILDCAKNGQLTEDFHTIADEKALYDYVRLEDIGADKHYFAGWGGKLYAAGIKPDDRGRICAFCAVSACCL